MTRYLWIPVALLPAIVAVSIARAGGATSADVARGRYLATVGGCADCHTSKVMTPEGPKPDAAMAFAGHPAAMKLPPAPTLPAGPWIATTTGTMTAWSGPWGTSFTANLTPDVETGLGSWTEATFVDTLRTGRHLGRGRPILPPMPWENVGQFTDDDLHALFAYLRSLPPVKNRVPDPLPPVEATPAAK